MKKLLTIALLFSVGFFCSSCHDDEDNTDPKPEVEETLSHVGHEYVDLGLPSGALWSSYEELTVDGEHFFAWGELDPRPVFSKDSYKLQNGKDSTLFKYCTKSDCGNDGFVDGLLELQPEDDPTVKHWGGNWRMPNWEEFKELFENCTWERYNFDSASNCYVDTVNNKSLARDEVKIDNGGNLYIGTSKINGKQITIPMTGAMNAAKLVGFNNGCAYWTSTLLADSCNYAAAWTLRAQGSKDGKIYVPGKRTAGHNVRPVIPGNRAMLVKMVDLGLPSGIKWAKVNIGALNDYKPGVYYAWGETTPKKMYNFGDYKYCSETNGDGSVKTLSKYVSASDWGKVDNLTKLDDDDDVAKQVWGNGWRMPTFAEMNELLEKCTITNETVDGVAGTKFTGPNGNSIFLPWAGTMYNGELEYPERAYYWTSSLGEEDCRYGEGLFMSANFCMRGNGFFRCSGRLVRAVHD